MRRAAVTLALSALLAGCGGHHHATTGTATAGPPSSLSALHPCPSVKHASCATLTVPLDHSGKVAGKLRLPVAVVGSASAPRGTLVFLTGGPGQPGVQFVPRIRGELGGALRGYRFVMLDQRGTGAGALSCPALQRAAGFSDLTVPPPTAVSDCAHRLGDKRRFFTTADAVADLEGLRSVLGAARWTLDGVSYGTFVAERYALAHPNRVRALVLDSVVPQEGINPFQLETIQRVSHVVPGAGDLAAVIRRYHDGPELLDTLVTLSIAEPSFRAVPRALREARAGNPARLNRLIANVRRGSRGPASLLSQGLHASTLCADYRMPWGGPDVPIARRKAVIAAAAAKLTPADLAPFDKATATGNGELLTCENWPPEPVKPPDATGDLPAVPVLLLAGDHDLSTPLQWARAEARHAPEGRLVVVPGAGHSVQLRARNPAGSRALMTFLQASG